MSWREFIASLVSSLAWPVTVAVCVVVFRRQISKLMSGLVLRRFKAGPGGVEAEFESVLALTEADLAETAGPEPRQPRRSHRQGSPPPVFSSPMESPPAPTQPGPVTDTGSALHDLAFVAQQAPRVAVIQGHLRLEDALRTLALESGHPQFGSAVDLARRAHAAGQITSETVAAIENLTGLRDVVAHSDAATHISVGTAEMYLALVDRVLALLRQPPPEPPA
jgi:hypothetical protein